MILVCEIIAFDGQSFTETLFQKGCFPLKTNSIRKWVIFS